MKLGVKHTMILTHLSNGLIPKQIGPMMDLSNRTVETYIDKMKTASNSNTTTQLVANAVRNKIIK
jgi:DNA-binding NarL/FixJ family response regulator